MVKVNVKWGKEKFPDVEIDVTAPVELLKAQLFALTSVPVDRQKIMGVKGGTLKDDADLSTLGIKEGMTLMLMGSAEAVPEAPPVATVFAEDMPAIEVAAMGTDNPGGLSNLGNTCYLNSTLQCMKAIPEVSSSLKLYNGAGGPAEDSFVLAMRAIITELERSNAAREVRPQNFVQTFHEAFPVFAQRTPDGHPMQQDAEECWSTIVNALSQRMQLAVDGTNPRIAPTATVPVLPRMTALKRNLGDMLFGIEYESSYKCLEGDEAYTKREGVRSIPCHISEKTAHLYTALDVNLDETVEKRSEVLGRDAAYSKRSRLARLPPIFAVQFVRFAFRKDTNKRAKILRTVSFPPMLDVRNLCTAQLQASIAAHCTLLEQERDAKAGIAKAPAAATAGADGDAPMPIAPPPAPPAGAAPASAGAGSSGEPMIIEPLEPPKSKDELSKLATDAEGAECHDNKTGRYELFAIITHQGRTAEGGHYVAWIKKSAKKWLVFDDETVAEVDAERIKELYGGGDWHMAYICLYRKMDTLTLDEEPKEKLELKPIVR